MLHPSRRTHTQAGVTLVETAIVLVLLGMLVAGIVAAQQLIAAAKVRSMTREIENKLSAVDMYVDKFRAYPGDMVNATTFFTTSANGDGNGRIVYASGEGNLAWEHLSLAGLVEGTFEANGADDILDTNIPRSNAAGGGAGFALDYNDAIGNHVILALADGTGALNSSVLTPETSYNVDKKMDDGLPTSGVLRATNLTAGTGCQDNTPNPPEYDYDNDELVCFLQITLN